MMQSQADAHAILIRHVLIVSINLKTMNWNESKSPTLQKVKEFKVKLMLDLLNQCTPEQQLFFKRMYSHKNLEKPIEDVVKDLPEEKYNWAICQIENSVEKNPELLKQKV
jgi:hypothetical protein